MENDTIFAEATVPGRAGVSVVRISGPQAFRVAAELAGPLPPLRKAGLRTFRDPGTQETLDEGLLLAFGKEASFTGEDVVELQLHGSRAVVKRILSVLVAGEGLRFAEAGEFTRRAMENGRLDLAQVEALGDLIEAETEAQRRQAIRGFDGALGVKVGQWRNDLIRAAGLAAASIDFADEEIPDSLSEEIVRLIDVTRLSVQEEANGAEVAERVRSGFEVAIVGRPNTGKSTLLNALARRDVALTSDIAGTTRDVLEVFLDLKGYPVTLLDTAGLRETSDYVEGLGIARAEARARSADLRVFVLEEGDDPSVFGLRVESGDLCVDAKGDLRPGARFPVSGISGVGLDRLCAHIGDEISNRASVIASAAGLRQKGLLVDAEAALSRAQRSFENVVVSPDIGAEELRHALFSLDTLIGRVGVEDMLDVVFSSFCVGK